VRAASALGAVSQRSLSSFRREFVQSAGGKMGVPMSAVKIAVHAEPEARQSLDTRVICSIMLFPGFHRDLACNLVNACRPLSTLDLVHLKANT
jgi:hypothetical protein